MAMALALVGCGPEPPPRQDDPFSPERAIVIGEAQEDYCSPESQCTSSFPSVVTAPREVTFEERAGGLRATLRVFNVGVENLRIDALAIEEEDTNGFPDFLLVGEETLEYTAALDEGRVIYIAPENKISLEIAWSGAQVMDKAFVVMTTNDPSNVNLKVPLVPRLVEEGE